MKSRLLLFFLVFSFWAYAQNENTKNDFRVKGNLFQVGLTYDITKLNNWTLQQGLLISKDVAANLLEIPLFLEYSVNSELDILFGTSFAYPLQSNGRFPDIYTSKRATIFSYFGTEFEFSDKTKGIFSVQYNLLPNNTNSSFKLPKTNNLKFNFGVNF